MMLKRLLPSRLHRWLSWARWATGSRFPKYELLGGLAVAALGLENRRALIAWMKDRSNWPDWYAEHTKGELMTLGSELMPDGYWQRLLDSDGRTDIVGGNKVLPPEVLSQIRAYMAPMDFWRAATGRVKSTEVANLVTHQLELGL